MSSRNIVLLLTIFAMSTLHAQAPSQALADKIISGRMFFNGLGKNYPPSPNVAIRRENIAGVSTFWFTPAKILNEKIVVYLHGGGYVWGSIESHRAMVSHIAEKIGTKILFIEYALAPENPFPNGLNDVISVYKHLIKKFTSQSLAFIGDSAGGGLVVATLNKIQQEDLPLPVATILISPWINLDGNTPSYSDNAAIDPILTNQNIVEYASVYNPTSVAHANPASLVFKSFPATLILVGSREILLDDSKIFYERVRPIQENSVLHIYEGETHVWLLSDITSKGARAAMQEMRDFLLSVK